MFDVKYWINATVANGTTAHVAFHLGPLEMGDPCGRDAARKCNNRGNCIRLGAINNFECKCTQGYYGKTCQFANYCLAKKTFRFKGVSAPYLFFPFILTLLKLQKNVTRTGTDHCNSLSAKCTPRGNEFECNCSKNSYWDSQRKL